jgi:glutamyl-tRNA synthetase
MRTRVRFAPSPTGYLHVGGLRTALYNFLLAKHHGGTAVLRIEDTDRSRFVEDAEADIETSLAWAGLQFDEGPTAGGEYGPYRQSERAHHYAEVAERLLERGHAYIAFDTEEELAALRESGSADGAGAGRYSAATRASMRNSLAMEQAEVQGLLESGTPYVVRLKVLAGETIAFSDIIRGEVIFHSDEIDDQILVKSDGMPTYHLANVVDDHLMGITHVVRGEEWLPSTPKHVLLYRALGWGLPIPVLVRDYVAAGFEPEALINYIAFLGWNPGTEQEVYGLDGLIRDFSLERVGSSGVQFSMDKLRWFNEQHLRGFGNTDLARRVRRHLESAGLDASDDYVLRVLDLLRERITLASDVADASYLFRDPDHYDEKGVSKRWKQDSPALLADYANRIEQNDSFTAGSAEESLRLLASEREVGAGRIIHPTRLAISGVTFGPGLFELMELLGRDVCLRRIRAAVMRLGQGPS